MAQNVKFISVKLQATYDALEVKDSLALYWIQDTQRLYKGDKLYGIGLAATSELAGLMSPEDKKALETLIEAGNGLSSLTAVDGTMKIVDTEDGGKAIGVSISAEAGNVLLSKSDGLYVEGTGNVDLPSYSIERQGVAEDGYAVSYKLKKTVGDEESYVGDVINIPKDMVLQSATLEIVAETGVPYDGAAIGDLYIKMTFNDSNASNIYIPMKGLVDVYTAGDGISISDNVISVKVAENSHGLVAVDGAMSISLATATSDGAMSKEDKVKLDAIPSVYVARKYEVSSKPAGTLIDYRDKEVRVMCPADTEWKLQNSGENADANMYYIGFKAYAPDDAVSFKEDLKEAIEDETMYYFENNDFAGVDAYGRKYSIVWLPAANYDGSVWTYYGAASTEGKYIGWYYTVEWYNADGKVIANDQVRINLSNEDCYSTIKPFYMTNFATSEEVAAIKESVLNVEESYTWNEL